MATILLILIAWLVEMPLWLSIVITVFCSLSLCLGIFNFVKEAEIEIETQIETKPTRKKIKK